MMRKILIVGILTFAMIASAGLVSAATTVDTTWDGGGYFNTKFTAGDDAHSEFTTNGAFILGEFHGKDYDDNPYSYNVDTVDSFVHASVAGGTMCFTNSRDDSKTSAYGNAGQSSYSFIGTDGTGEMSWGSWTNYATMTNGQYGRSPKTTNGKNFEATGNHNIYHELTDADGDGACIEVYGYGASTTSEIKLQGEKSGGTNSYFNFGNLPVCGDNIAWKNNYATFSGSGTGDFNVHAWADNGLTVGCYGDAWNIPGDGTDDSATYDLHVGYSGVWGNLDFGVSGN